MMPQANQGAPGPFQSGYSMFPNHLRTSDQRFVMGGVNQSTHSKRSSGGESNVSHAAVLAHAEREKLVLRNSWAITLTVIKPCREPYRGRPAMRLLEMMM